MECLPLSPWKSAGASSIPKGSATPNKTPSKTPSKSKTQKRKKFVPQSNKVTNYFLSRSSKKLQFDGEAEDVEDVEAAAAANGFSELERSFIDDDNDLFLSDDDVMIVFESGPDGERETACVPGTVMSSGDTTSAVPHLDTAGETIDLTDSWPSNENPTISGPGNEQAKSAVPHLDTAGETIDLTDSWPSNENPTISGPGNEQAKSVVPHLDTACETIDLTYSWQSNPTISGPINERAKSAVSHLDTACETIDLTYSWQSNENPTIRGPSNERASNASSVLGGPVIDLDRQISGARGGRIGLNGQVRGANDRPPNVSASHQRLIDGIVGTYRRSREKVCLKVLPADVDEVRTESGSSVSQVEMVDTSDEDRRRVQEYFSSQMLALELVDAEASVGRRDGVELCASKGMPFQRSESSTKSPEKRFLEEPLSPGLYDSLNAALDDIDKRCQTSQPSTKSPEKRFLEEPLSPGLTESLNSAVDDVEKRHPTSQPSTKSPEKRFLEEALSPVLSECLIAAVDDAEKMCQTSQPSTKSPEKRFLEEALSPGLNDSLVAATEQAEREHGSPRKPGPVPETREKRLFLRGSTPHVPSEGRGSAEQSDEPRFRNIPEESRAGDEEGRSSRVRDRQGASSAGEERRVIATERQVTAKDAILLEIVDPRAGQASSSAPRSGGRRVDFVLREVHKSLRDAPPSTERHPQLLLLPGGRAPAQHGCLFTPMRSGHYLSRYVAVAFTKNEPRDQELDHRGNGDTLTGFAGYDYTVTFSAVANNKLTSSATANNTAVNEVLRGDGDKVDAWGREMSVDPTSVSDTNIKSEDAKNNAGTSKAETSSAMVWWPNEYEIPPSNTQDRPTNSQHRPPNTLVRQTDSQHRPPNTLVRQTDSQDRLPDIQDRQTGSQDRLQHLSAAAARRNLFTAGEVAPAACKAQGTAEEVAPACKARGAAGEVAPAACKAPGAAGEVAPAACKAPGAAGEVAPACKARGAAAAPAEPGSGGEMTPHKGPGHPLWPPSTPGTPLGDSSFSSAGGSSDPGTPQRARRPVGMDSHQILGYVSKLVNDDIRHPDRRLQIVDSPDCAGKGTDCPHQTCCELDGYRAGLLEVSFRLRQAHQGLAPCATYALAGRFLPPHLALEVIHCVLNSHEPATASLACLVLAQQLAQCPPCAPAAKRCYAAVMVAPVPLTDRGLFHEVLYRLDQLFHATVEEGEEGEEEEEEEGEETLDMRISSLTLKDEEPEAYAALPRDTRLARACAVFAHLLAVLEHDLLLWLRGVVAQEERRASLTDVARRPLVVALFWPRSSRRTIGTVNAACRAVVRLAHAASGHAQHLVLRLLALMAEVVTASEEKNEARYPNLGVKCTELAREIANQMPAGTVVSRLTARLQPSWLALLVTHQVTCRLILLNHPEPSLEVVIACVNLLVQSANPTPPPVAAPAAAAAPRTSANKTNKNGETRLHVACRNNRLTEVRALLDNPTVDVNIGDNFGWRPLHEAVSHGRIDCVQMLLAYNPPLGGGRCVDVRAASRDGQTPLMDAAITNHVQIAEMLLRHAGWCLLGDERADGSTAYHLARGADMVRCMEASRMGSYCKLGTVPPLSPAAFTAPALAALAALLPAYVRHYAATYNTITVKRMGLRSEPFSLQGHACKVPGKVVMHIFYAVKSLQKLRLLTAQAHRQPDLRDAIRDLYRIVR